MFHWGDHYLWLENYGSAGLLLHEKVEFLRHMMLCSTHVAWLGWRGHLDLARVSHLRAPLFNHLLELTARFRTHVHNLREKHTVLLATETHSRQTAQHSLFVLLLLQPRRSHIRLNIVVQVPQMLLLNGRRYQLPRAYKPRSELIVLNGGEGAESFTAFR